MTLFSALGTPPFRNIKLRSRKPDCVACGRIDFCMDTVEETDYVQVCGGLRPDWIERGLVNGVAGHRASVKVNSVSCNISFTDMCFIRTSRRP